MVGELGFNPSRGADVASFAVPRSSNGATTSGFVPLSSGTDVNDGFIYSGSLLETGASGTTPANTDVPAIVANAPNQDPASVIGFPEGLATLQNPPAEASGFQVPD